MSYIGIGSPIPDISSLPGQTGGEVEVNLNYPSAAVCSNGSDQTPSVKSPNGGTFSSTPSGLSINSSSGVVDVSESTPNNYTISYTVEGVVSSFALTINQLEQSTFSYSASSFQQIGTATPTLASGTTAGGDFSASTGVVINTSTGVIDLAASTIGGPYTITYTTPGTCSTSSTFTLSITAVAVELIDNNFAMEFNGTDDYIVSSLDGTSTGGVLASADSDVQLSISVWFKITSSATGKGILQWANALSDGTPFLLLRRATSTTINTYLDGSYQSTVNVNDNQWYNAIIIRTSSDNTWRGYLNGSSTAWFSHDDGGNITFRNQAESLYLGNGYNGYFTGDIDEVAVWNRALETTDIQRIYNATANNPGKTANLFTAGLNTGLVYWNRMGD